MSIPPIEELELLHNHICRALGEPKRIQILYALHDQPCHVTGLAEQLDIPQPTVSRHLAVLRQSALVDTQRDGATIVYSVANPQIIDILDMMRDLLRSLLERQTTILG